MTTYLLLENGDYLLKEDGYKIILVIEIDSLYDLKFASINPTLKLQDNNFIMKSLNTSYSFNSTNNDFIIKNQNLNNINIKEAE